MRSGGTGEPPQGEVRKYKAASVSEGESGCDRRGIAAFSDDMIYSMSVWFSGGHFLLPEYGISTFIVVQ